MIKLAQYFKRDKRADGKTFHTLHDNRPEWLQEAVREAHQTDLPNDWIYETCSAAADAIDGGYLGADKYGDDLHEWADGQVEIYTKPLLQWVADMCLSSTYSNAESEADDLGVGGDTVKRAMCVQYCAIRAIGQAMVDAWREACEAQEDEASEESEASP